MERFATVPSTYRGASRSYFKLALDYEGRKEWAGFVPDQPVKPGSHDKGPLIARGVAGLSLPLAQIAIPKFNYPTRMPTLNTKMSPNTETQVP